MIETATPTASTASVAGVAFLAALPGVDAAVVLGAFSGAVVFVMTAQELKTWQKVVLFLPAFFAGLLCAASAAALISLALPESMKATPGIGALIAATIAVKCLIWLLQQTPESISKLWKRGP